nr:PREDICTED: uncharacterized protein LOC105669490 [Linepithema humile]
MLPFRLERILTLCRPEDSELALLLGGDCDEFLKHAFFGNIPVALVAKTSSYRYNALKNFALTRYSQTVYRGCINARSFLWTAWNYDLLSVIFICIEQSNEIFYYTYNLYSNNQNICKDMEFDKTSNLKGYAIRLNAVEMEPFITINSSAHNADKFHGHNSEIIKILVNKLRATLSVKVCDKHHDLDSIRPNGTLRGMLTSISDGKVDIGMNTRALHVLWKVKYTYPQLRSGLCMITQPIPEVSQFTKLITFMSPEVIAGMIITCLLIYLIFANNKGYIKAGLQVIRLVVCVGVFRPPKISSTRIFLCMALILFLNVNALFQSHLLSLLTVPIYKRDIDTLEGIKYLSRTGYFEETC